MSRPFLFIGTRAEDEVADAEFTAVERFLGIGSGRLDWIRLERDPMPAIDLDRYAGFITGGSPFNSSDPVGSKSAVQRRVEAELARLLDALVERDLPFLGACYGIGTLGSHQGALIDRTFGEPPGTSRIELTPEGARDPLCAGLPDSFDAFVGHKEAVRELPRGAVLLATSQRCPVQMFRVRQNLYATQFHPELDAAGLIGRLEAYQHHGYFAPQDLDRLVDEAHRSDVSHPHQVLANFGARYA
ncbi:glutamine amidotransferase [Naumannella sp. ID2617S]|nr:glutamine amidotransferase [Naumannella sp. ID2617S]